MRDKGNLALQPVFARVLLLHRTQCRLRNPRSVELYCVLFFITSLPTAGGIPASVCVHDICCSSKDGVDGIVFFAVI